MNNNQKLILFSKILSGKYSNKDQSNENPKEYSHINIYFRPLDWRQLNGPFFYSEQSYDYDPWSPYRQAIHHIQINYDTIIVENYQLINPDIFAGSGFEPELLKGITNNDFYLREGCSMHFKEYKAGKFRGNVKPGNNCLIRWRNKETYLVSIVDLQEGRWEGIDQGFDIRNNEKVWGLDSGNLIFEKEIKMDEIIEKTWLINK